ncbi:hypothetical protein [Streptomyces cylindrosporus]|uniref:Uncharacterized protein n=1 Tax=Streptomyces cylindrosporus TaxID=2927583 RepID=A0ABS9YI68_9ACTN|nr:hypothetical protein [Streptomyces cylindrosporus]MCI3276250.1 hypothetical protein [Streptomyces cylindrosporus]
MTEPTTATTAADSRLRRLLRLAVDSRRAVELEWEREKRERIDAQRRTAARVADDETYAAFPDTLAQVVESEAWVGYPALYVDGFEDQWAIAPCAVTYLDEGVWLHHTSTPGPDGYPEHRWTLIAPCVCGDFREVPVGDDYVLARELEHLDAHRDVCFGLCTPSDLPPAAARLDELLPGQQGAA